jgi:glycine/serine hydroxymethyltransferase
MKEDEMKLIATWINAAIMNHQDEKKLEEIRRDVKNLTKDFPLYKK